ncbi:hypothetical protein GE21DRAFT_9556 [Neurospora crassa]|uniref:protein-tyrosine-phosphatase n=1 Tax=Neurospora crassa (strain ATCC 24698 / 74-OR23-1A / CBS 708.71 / DSM 1257 / FGSC 987) TaxID=367110 RepID=Q7RXD5_NEUCR|nr:hypothetical protein NCU05049 [Neurospora crassa OR74A]EAA27187.2 hypothetical protein NCU05049 [Neurospora crassa OR74A]KHE83833.1 hypothetical protein GE21DRAFT_9556 [Neurospora crassa]|eukprot:XP_956423.2 hypothetical protein NCU05049 [Neurospora crassa OR74A]
MAPPPASMGHGPSSENRLRSRRRSSTSSTRSEHFAAAATSAFAVPTISVPTPTYSSHHRSSSSTSQHLSLPPFRHRRSSSSASQDSYRSPSPGSSRTSAFVLPPGVSISQITPNVFVGNNASSTSIQTLMHYGITSMVSLLSTAEQQLNEDAWNSPALGMLVPKQNRLFVRCGKVLIHCNQGVSRSGAACVAYIMKQQPNLSARKAVRFVQVRRKEVEPSATFLRQLGVWGEECKFDVWEEDVAISEGGVDGNGLDGKKVAHAKSGHENNNKKKKKVPKAPYKKWLDEREEMRRQVKEMGGLVLPQGGGIQV